MEAKALQDYAATYSRRRRLAIDYSMAHSFHRLFSRCFTGTNAPDDTILWVVDRALEQLKLLTTEPAVFVNQRKRICDRWAQLLGEISMTRLDLVLPRLTADLVSKVDHSAKSEVRPSLLNIFWGQGKGFFSPS